MITIKKHVLPNGKIIDYKIHLLDNFTIYEVDNKFFEIVTSNKIEGIPTKEMITKMYNFYPDDSSDSPSSLSSPIVVSVWDKDTFVID